MGIVVEFPGSDERAWRIIEAEIRKILQDVGVTPEAIGCICTGLKPRYAACVGSLSLQLEVPEGCRDAVTAAVERMRDFLHETTSKFLLQMAKLECELYVAKSGLSPEVT